ncbi:MAG: cytochrome c oxidase subunit 3 family protein, partial [Acidobacteriaceae bacterium]|nr:cytochrome c oxidase subunit 3 family protein [Acidobacteriaceae bacterium]
MAETIVPVGEEPSAEATHLRHHFASPEQQMDAATLGMWTFLITEVLFFGGMFASYAVYRNIYPEAFASTSQYMNVILGGTNTAVLICSSLTMALSVRAAQLSQRKPL